ncbi:hypothetical protein BDB00DRAFT_868329 [Zychaea mexicana]|uniref:uncharacterized protein n=1 Tax=Zychaea mexicana TaxID=64656 RepID=UPI0022FE00C5|nr:uncharacterized protein BDB00DRAFT_868329 [Zychaea mexicana]KAI9497725.1 hypothetical protein BDB00DRAFT_868329 [Zychaea mexicana]
MERCIEDILVAATDYYRVLGVSYDSSIQDIRRAYIKKSRFCHPDKFVPANPRATECFQLLNAAYHTLTDESLRFEYDCIRNSPGHFNADFATQYEYKGDMFERMVYQACDEMFEGQFHTLRVLFYTFRGTDRCTRVDDHIIDSIEYLFKNMYYVLMHTQSCYQAIKADLIELCQLQKQLRGLSLFDVGGRLRLSLAISKTMLKLILKSTTTTNDTTQKQHDDDDRAFERTIKLLIEVIQTIERKF